MTEPFFAELLIVGDDPGTNRQMMEVLCAAGYAAYMVGREALSETLRTRPPDLLLLACNGDDVRQTVRQVKQAAGPFMPVIVVAPAGDLAERAVLDAGADEFIPRSASNAELLIRIRAMLRLKRAYDALAELNDTLEEKVRERTRELEQAYATLRHAEKLSALGRLSATVAHEINNPLNGIIGLSDLIKEECPPDCPVNPHLHKDLNQIDRQLQAIAKLVRQLRDFGKPPSQERYPVVLNQVVQDVLHLVGKELRKRKIEVVQELDPDLPPVYAAPEQIGEVLMNLVLNAQDAMPEGGHLILRTGVRDEQVCLEVSDNGGGIPSEDFERIFEPFFTTKGRQGTGLGLAICYSIVREHGGEIRVESKVEQGSTFTVLLPVLKSEAG